MSRSGPGRVWDAVRPVIFWSHLAIGCVVGVVVLIMSVTGAALAYQRQMLERIAAAHPVAPSRASRLPLDTLVTRAQASAGGRKVAGLTVRADSTMPVSLTLDDRSSLFVDPYTGRVLGTDARIRGFFAAVERVHRSVVSSAGTRSETGTAVTGAANLGFLVLILTGSLLWWPRRWTPQAFRRVLAFSPGARGRARDWNWHHVLGFWSAPALVLVVASATFISYQWPQRLVERALGQPPGDGRPGSGERGRRSGSGAGPGVSLDRAWDLAMPQAGPWRSVQFRLAEAGSPVSLTVSHTGAFRPDQRTTITVSANGKVDRRGYDALDPARRVRAWMRPLHTGEVAGIPGQTVAALVSLAAAVLVWTGLALALRRLRRARRPRAA